MRTAPEKGSKMRNWIRKRRTGLVDAGASAVEYGLMVAAIAAVIVAVVFGLGNVVTNIFSSSCTRIANGASVSNLEC
jgi:pilus assembly protein Flp/PilA